LSNTSTCSTPSAPVDAGDLGEGHHPHGRGVQLLDGVLVRPEPVATVDQRDRRRDALEVERPVDGRVAATDDEHVLVAHRLELADEVDEAPSLERVRVGQRPRRERADPAGDDHGLGVDLGALVGADHEGAVVLLGQRLGPVAQQVVRRVRRGLFDAPLDQVLALDGREPRHVEDQLLGVQRCDLPARLRQRVHDRHPQATEPGVVRPVQARRPRADDGQVRFESLHDGTLLTCGHPRGGDPAPEP
jgi:hypothetical protein